MITPLVIVGGWMFWGIVAVVIAFDIFALSSDKESTGGWASLLLVSTVIGFYFFTDTQVTWQTLIAGFVGYLLGGVAWAMLKEWPDYIHEEKAKLLERYENFRSPPTAPFSEWSKEFQPTYKKNSARIVTWMCSWFLLFSWWLLTYPRHFFVWAAKYLSVKFDSISDRIWNS